MPLRGGFGLTTARECWDLWAERLQKAGSDADRQRALLAVQTHLARVAKHRPLSNHGLVMTSPALLVFIFWGPSFCAGGADHTYATTVSWVEK